MDLNNLPDTPLKSFFIISPSSRDGNATGANMGNRVGFEPDRNCELSVLVDWPPPPPSPVEEESVIVGDETHLVTGNEESPPRPPSVVKKWIIAHLCHPSLSTIIWLIVALVLFFSVYPAVVSYIRSREVEMRKNSPVAYCSSYESEKNSSQVNVSVEYKWNTTEKAPPALGAKLISLDQLIIATGKIFPTGSDDIYTGNLSAVVSPSVDRTQKFFKTTLYLDIDFQNMKSRGKNRQYPWTMVRLYLFCDFHKVDT